VNWFDILKVQILDTTTDLDINMEPMFEDKNDSCCQEAKMKYNKVQRPPKYAPYEYVSMADKLDCDEFKHFLGRRPSFRKGGWIKRIFDEWEECENV